MTIYPENLSPILDRIDPTFGRVIDCESGWWSLIERAHKELVAIDPDYRVYQIKEKFGTLRYYFAMSSPIFAEPMNAVVNYYERCSASTCEVTGKPGVLMFKAGRYRTLNKSFLDEGWTEVESI